MKHTGSEFGPVYEQNVDPVYAFVAYRLGDRQRAEDLTQATFERALRAWSRFDPRRASVQTWLFTIARNLMIDEHRRRQQATEERLEECRLPAQPGPEARLTGPELGEALSALSPRDREVVALRFGADLKGPEIAELLELSVANVHQILSRSLRRLGERLHALPATAPADTIAQSTPSAINNPSKISSAPASK